MTNNKVKDALASELQVLTPEQADKLLEQDIKEMDDNINVGDVVATYSAEDVEVIEQDQKDDYTNINTKSYELISGDEFRVLSDDEKISRLNAWREKYTNIQIANSLGMSAGTLQNTLRKYGLQNKYNKQITNVNVYSRKEIDCTFIENGAIFTGNMNLDELINKLKHFLSFAGDEKNYEFELKLTKK